LDAFVGKTLHTLEAAGDIFRLTQYGFIRIFGVLFLVGNKQEYGYNCSGLAISLPVPANHTAWPTGVLIAAASASPFSLISLALRRYRRFYSHI
jgi:hypothetical protein